MSTQAMTRSLCNRYDSPTTERGKLLVQCMRLRDTRAWITPYCYGWLRYTDDLKWTQTKLLELRKTQTGLTRYEA